MIKPRPSTRTAPEPPVHMTNSAALRTTAFQANEPPTLVQIYDAVTEILNVLRSRHKATYTIHEAAQLLGRSDYTIRRWVHEGRLAAIRINGSGPKGRLLIAHGELQRLLDGDASADNRQSDESTDDLIRRDPAKNAEVES